MLLLHPDGPGLCILSFFLSWLIVRIDPEGLSERGLFFSLGGDSSDFQWVVYLESFSLHLKNVPRHSTVSVAWVWRVEESMAPCLCFF